MVEIHIVRGKIKVYKTKDRYLNVRIHVHSNDAWKLQHLHDCEVDLIVVKE